MKKVLSLIVIVSLILILVPLGLKAGEPVKIRLVMKDELPSDPIVINYYDLLEKGLAREGIKVEIELIEMPAGNYAEKLNLMLLSGDIPDIIYFQGGDKQIADQGLLEDLTPYIESSKYIKPILGPHNIKRMENYPYLLWIKPLTAKVPVIRKDWFNQMETSAALTENPSIDNYYAFLKELKDQDLDRKGNPTYGVTVAGKMIELDSIFDQAFGNTSTWLKNENGQFIYCRVTNNEKEKLAFYHKLYAEGILDPAYLTKKWDTKEKVFYENQVGVISGTAGKVIDIYDGKMKKANGDEASLMVLPPAIGKAQGYTPVDVSKESRGIAISVLSKHKDIAFKILDFLASPQGQMIDRLGFENEHYQVEDGKIYLTEKSQQWFARFWEPLAFEAVRPLATPLLGEAAADSLNRVSYYYTEDINILIPEEYVAKWDAMVNLYKEYSSDIITGKRPLADFDQFVAAWYKAGGEEITKYANKILK